MFYTKEIYDETKKNICGVVLVNENPRKKYSYACGIFYDLKLKCYFTITNSYLDTNRKLENILDVISYLNKNNYKVSKYSFKAFINKINILNQKEKIYE